MKVGIFHTAFIGDLVLCGLLIEALYQEKHEIFLIAKKPSFILYKNDIRIKKIIITEKKRGIKKILSIITIAKKIRLLRLDAILVPHKSATSAMISYLSRVPLRVSYTKSSLCFLYTEKRKFLPFMHECLRCLELSPPWLVKKEIRRNLEKISRPLLFLHEETFSFSKRFPEFLKSDKPFFIVHPSAAWETKKYPVYFLAQSVYMLLSKNKELRCIVSGGENEKEDIKNFFEHFYKLLPSIDHRVFDASQSLPLNELISITAKAYFIIANDSAPLHIASGTNTPVIGIYGPTSWKTGFSPCATRSSVLSYTKATGKTLSCQPCSPHGHFVCPLRHFRCMRELTPEYLVKNVVNLLPELFLELPEYCFLET